MPEDTNKNTAPKPGRFCVLCGTLRTAMWRYFGFILPPATAPSIGLTLSPDYDVRHADHFHLQSRVRWMPLSCQRRHEAFADDSRIIGFTVEHLADHWGEMRDW